MSEPKEQATSHAAGAAYINALQNQRNTALNALAQVEAAYTVAQARIQELEKQLQGTT